MTAPGGGEDPAHRRPRQAKTAAGGTFRRMVSVCRTLRNRSRTVRANPVRLRNGSAWRQTKKTN